MAGRQRKVCSAKSSNNAREVMRPIISSDVMGNRNVEIVPVGAWVEPADRNIQQDALIAARIEEEKINRIRWEKENRLRSFRRQVKKRVSHASQMKRQQQIQEAEKAFELERRVIQQSYEMGTSSRKDTCSMRNDELEHAIKMRLLKKYGEDVNEWKTDREKDFSDDVEENMRVTTKARQQLVSKMSTHPSKPSTNNSNQEESHSNAFKVSRDIQRPTVKSYVDPNLLPSASLGIAQANKDNDCNADNKDKENDGAGEESEGSEFDDMSDDGDDNESDDSDNDNIITIGIKSPSVKICEPQSTKKSKKSKKRPASARLAALLSQFTESEALARQKRQQAAVSRRIFMDREREAVRENMRRKQHKKKIASLKKEKEAYRQQLESLAEKELDAKWVGSGDDNDYDEEDEEMRKRLEEMHFEEMVERRKQDLRRSREMERYLDALRHNLIERARRAGIRLPALCACGEIWDTHPETCANNCFFYKNNRAYARALQSLLASTEVM